MTYSPQAILAIYNPIDKHIPSMENSGVAANKSGYHNSYNGNKARAAWRDNYSVIEKLDQEGDRNAASAWDAKFSPSDMRLVTTRLMNASLTGDPRLYPVREWFGSYDGKVVTGYSIFRRRKASSDSSHLWHIHVSGWRKYANDRKAWMGVAEIICGLPAGALTDDIKIVLLPTYYVDPAKVSTTLIGNAPTGLKDVEREPGFAISNAVRIEGKWLITADEYRYHTDYLTTVEPAPKPTDPPASEEPDEEPKPEVPVVKYLPPRWVDPAKVDTFLYGVRHSDAAPVKERQPGYKIDTGVELIKINGKEWLLTEAGYRYRTDLLTTTEPKIPEKKRKIVIATWNPYVGNSLTNMKKGFKAMVDAGASAIGVQELSNDAKQKGLTEYAKALGFKASTRNSAVTVFWDPKVITDGRTSHTVIEKGGRKWESGAGGDDTIYKIIMMLDGKVDGEPFALLNHHLTPTVESGGAFRKDKPVRVSVFKKQISGFCTQVRKRSGLVFGTADWNVAWGTEAGDWVEAQLDAVGVTVCWDEAVDKSTHTSGRTIDWTVAKGADVESVEVLGSYGGDHKIVVTTYSF